MYHFEFNHVIIILSNGENYETSNVLYNYLVSCMDTANNLVVTVINFEELKTEYTQLTIERDKLGAVEVPGWYVIPHFHYTDDIHYSAWRVEDTTTVAMHFVGTRLLNAGEYSSADAQKVQEAINAIYV